MNISLRSLKCPICTDTVLFSRNGIAKCDSCQYRWWIKDCNLSDAYDDMSNRILNLTKENELLDYKLTFITFKVERFNELGFFQKVLYLINNKFKIKLTIDKTIIDMV